MSVPNLPSAALTPEPSSSFDVADYGALGWTVSPELCSNQVASASGTAILTRMKVAVGGTVTTLYYSVTNAAASLTSAHWQLYDTTGTLRAQTADLSSLLSAGDKVQPLLLTPLTVTAGQELWAVFYSIGTTGPTIRATTIIPSVNFRLTSSSPVRTGRKTGVTADLTSVVKTDYTSFSNQIPFLALGP